MLSNLRRPIIGFAAFSGTGKTTLLMHLLPLLRARGLRIGMIKHAHHTFELDYPGKDSFELRKAGAAQILVASRRRWALVSETPERPGDPPLDELLAHLDQDHIDLILVEGFKHEAFPKIELHRPSLRHPLLATHDPNIIAVASDAPVSAAPTVAILDLNDPAQVADFIQQRLPQA